MQDAVERWKLEAAAYEALLPELFSELGEIQSANRLRGRFSGRVKSTKSVRGKLVARQNDGTAPLEYLDRMGDKLGVRFVCFFPQDRVPAVDAIRRRFPDSSADDKKASLQVNQFGYGCIHVDIQLDEGAMVGAFTAPFSMKFEAQIRTLGENFWAEMYHDLGYKASASLGAVTERRAFSLAGMLEVADDHVWRMAEEEVVFEGDFAKLHQILLGYHYALSAGQESATNNTLSSRTFQVIKPVLDGINWESGEELESFHSFVSDRFRALRAVINRPDADHARCPFAAQAEMPLLAFLRHRHRIALGREWQNHWAIDYLDTLDEWLGL